METRHLMGMGSGPFGAALAVWYWADQASRSAAGGSARLPKA